MLANRIQKEKGFFNRKLEEKEKAIRLNLGQEATLHSLILQHSKLNLEKFNWHKHYSLGQNSASTFTNLVRQAKQKSKIVIVRAEPIWDKCNQGSYCFKCTHRVFILDENRLRDSISNLISKIIEAPVFVMNTHRPVCKSTISNCRKGNQIPAFDTLMKIGLMHGYKITITLDHQKRF